MLDRNFVKPISGYVIYDVRYTFAIYIVHISESIYVRVKKIDKYLKCKVNKSFLYKTKIGIDMCVLFLLSDFLPDKSMNKRM